MRLHVVDGTFELYRAHYSKRPSHTSPSGRDLKATVGVVSSILALLEEPDEEVTHLAVAFDNPIRSFRNDLFAGYKGDEGVPPELRSQFDDVEEAVRALGVVVWSMREFEADDALATAATRWASADVQVRLLTPDKDLGQVLRGDRVVQVDRIRRRLITEDDLRRDRGVGPESVPDLLALVGDDADGIPGLPGFGAKGAAAVLARYGQLEAIPPSAGAWDVQVRGAERLAATLAAQREDALLYRRLATLARDVPLAETLDDLLWRGVPREPFERFCTAAGADTLRGRVRRWAA